MHSLYMPFQPLIFGRNNMRSLFNTKITKDIFLKKNVDTLFEHWPYDYVIDLEEGMQPPFGPIYNLL
jgi:hypothetical protein